MNVNGISNQGLLHRVGQVIRNIGHITRKIGHGQVRGIRNIAFIWPNNQSVQVWFVPSVLESFHCHLSE